MNYALQSDLQVEDHPALAPLQSKDASGERRRGVRRSRLRRLPVSYQLSHRLISRTRGRRIEDNFSEVEQLPLNGAPTSSEFIYASNRLEVRRNLRLRCQVVTQEAFRLVGDVALDLSLTGILVRCSGDISSGDASLGDTSLGDHVYVSLPILGGSAWLDTEGEVRRMVHGRRGPDRGLCAGIAFTSLQLAEYSLLRAGLSQLPPPVPTRPLRRDYARSMRTWADDTSLRPATRSLQMQKPLGAKVSSAFESASDAPLGRH